MSSYPIPDGAIVLDHPAYTDEKSNVVMPAMPMKEQPASIVQDVNGTWPFILVGGVERQFSPPAEPQKPAPLPTVSTATKAALVNLLAAMVSNGAATASEQTALIALLK